MVLASRKGGCEQTKPIEFRQSAGTDEVTAHFIAGEVSLIDQRNAKASPGEVTGCCRAGWAGTDDGQVRAARTVHSKAKHPGAYLRDERFRDTIVFSSSACEANVRS
jgi:hypothetical protein